MLKDVPAEGDDVPADGLAAEADDDLNALLEEMGEAAEEPAPVECFLPPSPTNKAPTLAKVLRCGDFVFMKVDRKSSALLQRVS